MTIDHNWTTRRAESETSNSERLPLLGNFRKFGWQDGFGAFTVSVSQKNRVVEYIENQMEHHAGHSFQDEYLHLLKKHEVEYDPRYVWD